MTGLSHEISVSGLQALLAKLEPTDVLLPNRVANLTILRDDNYIGFIDLMSDTVEIFEEIK